MARKLYCKLTHEHGQKVCVGAKLYTIGTDGIVEVDDDHAPLLLANDVKWADPKVTTPYKRPSGPPQLILADAQGRVLSPEETAKKQAEALAAVEKVVDPVPAPAEEPLEPEPAPGDWPAQSLDTPKGELLANLEQLKVAGHVQPGDFHGKMSKSDLLEVIERAYDSMA